MQASPSPYETAKAIGELIGFGVLLIAYLDFRYRRKADTESQITMHAENKSRLENLVLFHKEQDIINKQRDVQINQLMTQTATLMQMASGQERRLQMLEDR